MFTEEELNGVLNDDNVFDEKVPSIYWLKQAAQAHPEHAENLAHRFFAKPRIKFLNTHEDLKYLLELFPQRKNDIVKLLTKLLTQTTSSTNFTYNLDELKTLQKLLPEDAENLIKLILKNYFYFDRINDHSHNFFSEFIKAFPNLKDFFLNLIVENPIESQDEFLNLPSRFEMLFKSSYDVENLFSNNMLTSQEKNTLIQIVLDNQVDFDRIFKGDFFRFDRFLKSLINDSYKFSASEDSTKIEPSKIYVKLVENILEYKLIDTTGKLIEEKIDIGSDPITENYILHDALVKRHLHIPFLNQFLNLLLTYPSSFERLITTEEHFQKLKTMVQELKTAHALDANLNYDMILNKPNRLEALKLIRKNYADIRRAARAMWQGKSEDQNSPIAMFPPEILASIICYTRDPAISEADAYKIALKYLSRPALLIDSIDDLEYFIKKFPQYRNQFADEILSSVATYKHVIRSNDDLKRFANLFPDRPETFSDTDDDYERFVGHIWFNEEQIKKDFLEIRKNARVLGQTQPTRDLAYSSLFARLPKDLLKKVIIDSRPEKQISDKEATKLAEEFLNKPKPPQP